PGARRGGQGPGPSPARGHPRAADRRRYPPVRPGRLDRDGPPPVRARRRGREGAARVRSPPPREGGLRRPRHPGPARGDGRSRHSVRRQWERRGCSKGVSRMRVRTAVFPAAGLATRFLPATKAQPKEMLPLVDKPMIQYVVEEAVAAGLDRVNLVTGRGKRAIEDHFDSAVELEFYLQERGKWEELAQIKTIS